MVCVIVLVSHAIGHVGIPYENSGTQSENTGWFH